MMHCSDMFTWEPVSHLDCPDIIEAYEKAKKDKTSQKKEKEEVRPEVKKEVKQEAKHEVKKKVNDTKQWLLKRPKKKSKKVFSIMELSIYNCIILRQSQTDGNEVSPPKKSLVLNKTDRAY